MDDQRPSNHAAACFRDLVIDREVTEPEQCRTMAEVRAGVDSIDRTIVGLLGIRFRFMAAAARIKPERGEVRDEARKQAVLDHVSELARKDGAPEALIVALYEQLVEASIAYELERFDQR